MMFWIGAVIIYVTVALYLAAIKSFMDGWGIRDFVANLPWAFLTVTGFAIVIGLCVYGANLMLFG